MLPFFLSNKYCMNTTFVCSTLIDITETKIIRGDSKERNQQRNWESVLQVLGLRTQPIITRGPAKITAPINLDNGPKIKIFGDFYQGTHDLWYFWFTSDRDDVYSIKQLEEDFEQVPVILGLDETARFMLPIFHTNGILKNIAFGKTHSHDS